MSKKRNEMSKKRNPGRPGTLLTQKIARRTAERLLKHAAELRRLTKTKLDGRFFDGDSLWQSHHTIAQTKTNQPAMRAKAASFVEELLEAAFADPADEGEFGHVVAGPPGAAFPVPDEFQFPKHTAPH